MRLVPPARAVLTALAVLALAGCSTHADPMDAADPRTDEQWGFDVVNSRSSWEYATGKDVVIAVIDTGVDDGHRDLRAQTARGDDFVDGDRNPKDENGHGTHVAGIAAAAAKDYGIIGANVINLSLDEAGVVVVAAWATASSPRTPRWWRH